MRGRVRVAVAALCVMGTPLLMAPGMSYYDEALPSTMNPLFARSMVDKRTHELVFDRLFYRYAVTNELRSRLVTKYERLEDGKVLKVHLRDDVEWHDGKKLTALDVCFTIDAMLNPRTPSPVAKGYREVLESCEADKKENTATIRFRRAYHNLRERLSFSVLPQHAFDSTAISPDLDFSSRPTGSGPMTGSKGRREVKHTAYANGHHAAKIETLQMAPGGDPFVQVRTLLNGGVHGIVAVAPQLRGDIAASDEIALKSYDLRSWWFVALNTNKGALKYPEVRKALNHTIDRAALRELTIGVTDDDPNPPCEFISGPFVQSSPYNNRAVPIVETSNADIARQAMLSVGAEQQAGRWVLDGQPVSLRIGMLGPLDNEAKDLLNQVGNQLQEGGFDRQVHRVNSDEWTRKAITGRMAEYDLLIGKWSFGTVEDVGAMFHTRRDGKGSLNIFNHSDPETDRLLATFEASRTDTEARDAYHDLHAHLAEQLPYLFLWKLDTKSSWRNEVRNATITPYYYFTEFDEWSLE